MTSFIRRLCFLLLITSTPALSQPTGWLWAHRGGSSGTEDYCRGVSIGSDGTIYVTGDFKDTTSFLGTRLHSKNAADCYIAAIRPDGSPLWVRSFGDFGPDVGVDIIAGGGMRGCCVVGTCQLPQTLAPGITLSATEGSRDAFFLKMDDRGGYEWARTFGSDGADAGNEVVDGPDGSLWGTGPFGGDTLRFPDGSHAVASGGDADVWIAGFRANGDFIRGFTLQGSGHEEGRGIEVDVAGNILLAGEFDAAITIGRDTLTTIGMSDIFVVKYDPEGRPLFAKHWGGSGVDHARGIGADGSGNIYVSGVFSGTVDFEGSMLTALSGMRDIFVLKLASDGRLLWVKQLGGPGNDEGSEIEVDPHGTVTLTPDVTNGCRLPDGTLLDGLRVKNQLVLRLDSAGTMLSYDVAKGSGAVINFALGVSASGDVCVVGSFTDTLTFGGIPLAGEAFTSGRVGDFYVAYLRSGAVSSITDHREIVPVVAAYPNPATSSMTLRGFAGSVSMYDMLGRRVWHGEVADGARIDVSRLPQGVYALRTDASSMLLVKK